MRILIATVQVPFVRGGAEILAEGLCEALRRFGHEAEIAALPFRWNPPDQLLRHTLACRSLNFQSFGGQRIDRVIGLKYPAYLVVHPDKVLWLLHQHRTAYELWDRPGFADLAHFPDGLPVRDLIRHIDSTYLAQVRKIYTIAANVSQRLRSFNGMESEPLYHPPYQAERFYCATAEDYLFFPSRVNPAKRQALVVEALAKTESNVRVVFTGSADNTDHLERLLSRAEELQVRDRVDFRGHVTAAEQRDLYARSIAVLFPPFDEDYGYITLEAMLSAKPVISCRDSGGPLEFIVHGQTGLIVDSTADSMALAMDQLWLDRNSARQMGEAGRDRYEELGIGWRAVVERLAA